MKIDVADEFIALASLNSPSRREGPVAEYLVDRLRGLGVETVVDDSASRSGSDTGNVIARLPGNAAGPAVLLCAHMDTVGPTEGMVPVVRDGVVYSNGETVLGADDKAGMAIILGVLAGMKDGVLPHGPIVAVFTVQEEVGLFGAHYLPADLRADFGYVLDGDGPVGNIVHRAPSKVDLDFVIEGRAAHAGISPEKGVNAIVAAAAAIAHLRWGRLDRETTSNVGLINGGKARNIVPDRAEVAVEVRSIDREKLENEIRKVVGAFEEASAAAGAGVTVRREISFEAFTVAESHPVIANAFRAARSLGIESRLWTTGAGMDANIFNLRGVPCVGLGIGIEDSHSPKEHIAVSQMETGVRFIEALLAEAVYRRPSPMGAEPPG